MVSKFIHSWPFISSQPSILLKELKQWNELDINHDRIVALTDGWREGPVAAILRGGINATAVLNVLAQSGVKDVKIIHLEEKIPQMEEIFLSTVVVPANALFDSVSVIWRRDRSVSELVENVGKDYKMLFFGAPLAPSEIMPFYDLVKSNYQGGVTIVRGPASEVEIDAGDEISGWVRERTFDAADYSLPGVLKNCKKRFGKKVAVLLPSLNEERTVGQVIKTALEVKKVGVIDEVILIDSASVDSTVEIAKSFDIPVYSHPEIRADLGSHRGKGEAMFKSAFVTDCDIIAWVDTDIESITPRFFYGLLGPLLTDPAIKFSKGYFERPVRVEASGIELGGGRVTEILARPWINAFMPELSGYIQPLAGTVAIYRDTFMNMRIPANYGVEMAMLVQAVQQEGLWSTCQVNLGEVIHRSKDVIGLSEMAFQILQVLGEMGCSNTKPNEILRRTFSSDGHFEMGLKRFRTFWRQFTNEYSNTKSVSVQC